MKVFKKIIKWTIILFSAWMIIQAGAYYYWIWKGWNDSNLSCDIDEHIEGFSSDELLKKVKGHNLTIMNPYRESAWGVLIDRKDKRVVPILIKELKSWNRGTRVGAIRALGEIGDPRAIEPLMKVVNKAKIDPKYRGVPTPDYIVALQALAKMKHEPVYHYAIEFATRKDISEHYVGEAIEMFESFEKPESIFILKKIAEENPKWPLHEGALEVIKRIESVQKE